MSSTILILVSVVALGVSLIVLWWVCQKAPRDAESRPRALRRALFGQAIAFLAIYVGVTSCAIDLVYGQQKKSVNEEAVTNQESARGGLGLGDGLGLLGVALATGLSVVGAGYAVAVVGSAALGAIAEKPELFGRTLIFVGLAEGLAIYGLIVSILILGRLG